MIKKYLSYLGNSQYENYVNEIKNVLKRQFKDKEIVNFIDIGCGPGLNTLEITSSLNVRNIFGIENNRDYITTAKERNINILDLDLSEKNWKIEEKFDFVYSNQVIEHLYSVDNFMLNIKTILKDDGVALISTENLSAWHNVFSLMLGYQPFSTTNICTKKWSIGNPLSINTHEFSDPLLIHRAVFTNYALNEFLQLYGFKIIANITSGYYPFPNSIGNIIARLDRRHANYIAFLIAKL